CYLGRLGAGVQLEQAVEWVQTLFPGDSVLSALTPTQMARKLIGQRNRSGWGLLLLIEVFVGAAILTINMITFLERRRELAVLKTLGMSNSQISLMLGTEILGATGAGLVIGGQVIRLAGARASWMVEISASSLARLHLLGAMLSLVATGLAVAVPVVMARVAAVNELLFARTIPIARQTVNQVEHTYSWVVERERSEGVRLLRLDLVDGDFDGILMKSPGDKVKRGEVIASLDTMFGFHRKQWASPCDGRIVEYEAVSGYMVIQPNERLAPVSIQVQTFQAGPAHSPGNWQAAGARSRLQPVPTTMSSATVPRGRVVWWKRPAVLGGVLCAMLAVSGLGMLMPRGLPVTNYPFASPYPSYEQWVNDLRLLASDHPDLVRLSVLGQTHEGREILGLTITDFAAGDDTTKPGFLLIAGQHANEAIGWQVGLAVLEQLLDDYGTQTEAAEILKQKAIYAVPMVNPDGYEIFTKVTTMHRANGRPIVDNDGDGQFNEDPSIFPSGAYLRSRVRFAQDWLLEHADDPFVLGWQEHAREEGTNYRLLHGPDQQTYVQVDQDGDGRQAEDPHDGVDPNRNFAANWRKLGIIGEYGGEEPWSDAESRAVRDLVLAHPNIRQAVDLHSGQEQILFPYAFGSAKAPDHERFLTWGNTMRPNELIKVQPYHKLNEHSGTAMDWLYSQGIKPFVFEVYHGRVEYRVYYGGTYGYDWNSEWIYNPRDDAARQTVIERWVPVIYEWMAVSP
ncbi:MAG: M14 family zinc carboxypeptidase, partial [Bacillota bacterium]